MSFFILQHDDAREDQLERHSRTLAGHGFHLAHEYRLGRLRLRTFGNLAGSPPACYEAPNGDAIIVLGSLVYAGNSAPACLPQLLSAFDPLTFAWRDLLGTYVIIVRRGTRLHFVTDGLGACRLYHDSSRHLWSNAFLPFCELMPHPRLDLQACYEYVVNGAVFGERTLLEDVSALPANTLLGVDSDGTVTALPRPSPIAHEAPGARQSLDALAATHVQRLDRVFEPLAAAFGSRIHLSFSGGFDSRLMLAMLIRHGLRPPLFVYGSADDDDVRIARLICEREGLELNCIDKQPRRVPPDAVAEHVERDLFAFDGWKVEQPLFDLGVDRDDRLARHRDGGVPLNGSLGEIYRNFFYMPDGPSSTERVISTFYSPFDPAAFTARFVERDYRAHLARAMRESIGASADALARSQVEMLYPNFRGRYWTGRDAQLNQRFGTMFLPYLEPAAITDTACIPMRYKNLGRLQGRMIALANPQLARYPSDYGFSLEGPRPLKYRLTTWLGTQRPPGLRKLSFRLRHRRPQPHTGSLAPELLAQVIDPSLPVMRELFDVPRLYSSNQYGLAATLEYLVNRFGIDLPPRG